MRKAQTHHENEGVLETMFRVPAKDTAFIEKLKKYSTDRITRVRKYGQRPKDPSRRGSGGYVKVADATWFSVMLDDEMVTRERDRAMKADKAYRGMLAMATERHADLKQAQAQLATAKQDGEKFREELNTTTLAYKDDLAAMHKSYVENVESIEFRKNCWIAGFGFIALTAIIVALWATEVAL